VLNTIQRPLSVALTLVCALVLAGCVNTPAAHDERSTKAAGVASISIVMPHGLWTETLPAANNSELHDLEPTPLEGEEGERGLVRVNLTGTQLVEYLDSLNQEAHSTGIMRSSSYNPAAASRVYTAVSEVVDQISVRRDEGEPDPEVIIDDTVGDEQE
jgi:hypothetical protein